MGMASFDEYVEEGLIELFGLASHVNAFPTWFKFSVFAGVEMNH
jgi:hypothetical protein